MRDINHTKQLIIKIVKRTKALKTGKYLCSFIEDNWNEFPADYKNTIKKIRYTFGKLETIVIKCISKMLYYQNTAQNVEIAKDIMVSIGYPSYYIQKDRYKNRIQNTLKLWSKSKKCNYRIEYAKAIALPDLNIDWDKEFNLTSEPNDEDDFDILYNPFSERMNDFIYLPSFYYSDDINNALSNDTDNVSQESEHTLSDNSYALSN